MAANQLLAQFASQPALVEPAMSDLFQSCLESVVAHSRFQEVVSISAADDFWDEETSWVRPYEVSNGILQIPVQGVLLNGFPYQFMGYATGYEYIQKALERGMSDSNVKGIAFIINSPGGMVAGNFDLVDRIHARRGEKPMRAYAAESAYSAAYSIASAADSITVARTGGVGSIGVVTSHTDFSSALDQQGIKVTFIHAGKYKTEGNSAEPLSSDAKARIQARIDELYEVFVSSVARNRDVDAQAVRDTEALTFTATQALSNGLADFIGPLDDALSAFADDLSSEGDENMSTPKDTAAVDQAAIDTAVAAALATANTAHATAVAEARTAERARVSGITGCDEAKGREALASHIAMNTEMSVDDAKAMLAAAPLAAVAPVADTQTPFDAAASKDNPDLGAGNGTDKDGASDDRSGDILALVRNAGIVGFTSVKK